MFEYYVIVNKNGLFYAGHSGTFDKKLKNARFFQSEKTAKRFFIGDSYNDLSVAKITMNVGTLKAISHDDFEEVNNYDYKVWEREQKENEIDIADSSYMKQKRREDNE